MNVKVRIKGATVDSLLPHWLQNLDEDYPVLSGRLVLKDSVTGIRDAQDYDLLAYDTEIGAVLMLKKTLITIPYHNVLGMFIEGVGDVTRDAE